MDMSELSVVANTVNLPTPKLRKTVSHSEVETYLKCERAHYYGYGMQISHKYPSDALTRGGIGHKALEVYFVGLLEGRPPEECEDATRKYLGDYLVQHFEHVTLVNELTACINIFFDNGGLREYEILAVEKEFVLSITDDLEMPYIPDLIVRDKQGRIGVIDHKFIKTLYSDRDTAHMPQLAKYTGALRVMGYKVEWTALNELKWSAPTGKPESKYKFEFLDLSEARVLRSFKEQVIASTRIQERKQLVVDKGEAGLYEWGANALRAENIMICGFCSFRAICEAELNDYQPQLVLDNEYVTKTRREFGGSTNGR